MSAGRGFIAITIVALRRWNPSGLQPRVSSLVPRPRCSFFSKRWELELPY
jgi:hypothetical protein